MFFPPERHISTRTKTQWLHQWITSSTESLQPTPAQTMHQVYAELREKKIKRVCAHELQAKNFSFFFSVRETVTGSLGCTVCTLRTVRGDASCVHVWVAPNEVSCLTTHLNLFSSLSFMQAWFGLCSFQYLPVNPERFCRPSNRPINTVTGREVCVVRSQDLSSRDRPAGDVQHVARGQNQPQIQILPDFTWH